jgi:hypothetical protein
MKDDECIASAIEHSTFLSQQRSSISNSDCSLTYDGWLHHVFPSGMATAVDTAQSCTSLISDVLDYHLIQMKIDGFIDQVWEKHLKNAGNQVCVEASSDAIAGIGDGDTTALGLKEMGGIFVFHSILSLVAILFAIFQFFFVKKRTPTEFRDSLKASFKMQQRLGS